MTEAPGLNGNQATPPRADAELPSSGHAFLPGLEGPGSVQLDGPEQRQRRPGRTRAVARRGLHATCASWWATTAVGSPTSCLPCSRTSASVRRFAWRPLAGRSWIRTGTRPGRGQAAGAGGGHHHRVADNEPLKEVWSRFGRWCGPHRVSLSRRRTRGTSRGDRCTARLDQPRSATTFAFARFSATAGTSPSRRARPAPR